MKMHQVVILGEPEVEACERTWNNFCRLCEAEESGQSEGVPVVSPVRYEVLRESDSGKWVRVLGPTTRVRAEQWWVLYYRDGGPRMRVQEV